MRNAQLGELWSLKISIHLPSVIVKVIHLKNGATRKMETWPQVNFHDEWFSFQPKIYQTFLAMWYTQVPRL